MVVIADGHMTARMTITDLGNKAEGSEVKDFKVVLSVSRGNDIYGKYTRVIDGFPANALNTVALVKTALNLFSMDSLAAEDDDNSTKADSSNMERGLSGTMRPLPTQEESRLRHH